MRLLQILPLGALPEAEALALARGMEAHAHHPIARAQACLGLGFAQGHNVEFLEHGGQSGVRSGFT